MEYSIGEKVKYYRRHGKDRPLIVEESTIITESLNKFCLMNPVQPYNAGNPKVIYRLKNNVWNHNK